ncbi:MAG: HDIG domain-containing protein [Deltaproteobacteria bacterium]|nr:HDIG domain-containing protein [Deltaproteobacteria bacterium]
MIDYKLEKSLKKVLGGFSRQDFSSLTQFLHSSYMGWFLFILMVAALSLTLSFHVSYLPSDVKLGQKAPKDIKADQAYSIVDEQTTTTYRQEALDSVLATFDYYPSVATELEIKVDQAFVELRDKLKTSPNIPVAELTESLTQRLGVKLSEEDGKFLYNQSYSELLEVAVLKVLRQMMLGLISSDQDMMAMTEGKGIILRTLEVDKEEGVERVNEERVVKDLSILKSYDEVISGLESFDTDQFSLGPLLQAHEKKILHITSLLIKPNAFYNAKETEYQKAQAVKNVPAVTIKVGAGEYIIRSGESFTQRHITILDGIQKQKKQTSYLLKFVGTVLFVALLILIIYTFAYRFIRKFKPSRQDLIFLGSNLFILLITVRFFASMSGAIKELFPTDVPSHILYYAIPMAGSVMLVRILINSEVALVFSVAATSLAGLFLGGDLGLPIYLLMSSITAASSIAYADKRSSILKAGLVTGAFNCIVIFSIKLIQFASPTEALGAMDLFYTVAFGFIGGIISSFYVMVLSPVAETIFDYTSDITLLELGNNNHPLLREMILKAPGTYHHSQLVSILAEAAARGIGANPLLCRVGAYFHDIGKMKKAPYFIENQQGGENRHDKLSPSMSALVISSHVKEGLELAKQYKLPQRIAAFIPEHQGTKIMTYFYNKAKEQEDPNLHTVNEKDYRYPGPRPQTRESGIILLADGVEAAVRSLPEKTPAKVQAMVQKIVNKNFSEEQLDECELTLKDLHLIGESFVNVLLGIYHQRIEYPDIPEEKNEKPKISLVKNLNDKEGPLAASSHPKS